MERIEDKVLDLADARAREFVAHLNEALSTEQLEEALSGTLLVFLVDALKVV